MNRFFILLIAQFFITNSSYTQVLKTYSGTYSCDVCERREDYYSEKATYSYYENEKNERIYDGKFVYSALVNAHINNLFDLITIETNYVDGFISGKWNYSKEVQLKNKEQKYVNYMGRKIQLTTPVTNIKGEFVNGYRVNSWEVITSRDNIIEEHFKAVFNEKGNLISGYSFISNKVSILGQFDENSLFNNLWEIKWNIEGIEFKSVLEYYKGFLVNITTINESNGEFIKQNNNKDFMEKFILSLEKNKFYAIVNNEVYVPIEKKYELGYYSNYDFGVGFELTNYDLYKEDIEMMLLYRSLKFWRTPIEIAHGIKTVSFSPENTYKKISEDELLLLADSLKLSNDFTNTLKQKKRNEELKIIKEKQEKELEEKKQNQLVKDKQLFKENINYINHDKYKTSLNLLQKHGGYGNKKQLLLTYDLIKNHFVNNYSFSTMEDFNEINFNASKQLINLFETLKIIYQDKNSDEIEKSLKKSNAVEDRISIINNYFTNTQTPSE